MTARAAFFDALQFRHACRLFDRAKKIADHDLQYILEAGRLAPSALGLEPWKFIVVLDQPHKQRLQDAAANQLQVGSASAVIVILAKLSDLAPDSSYTKNLFRRLPADVHGGAASYYGELAPRIDLRAFAIANCNFAAANMMAAAAVIGIDSCPVGAFDAKRVIEALEVDPKRYAIALLLPIGYRATSAQPERHRLPLDSIVEYR